MRFKSYFSYEIFHGHSNLRGELGSTEAAAALGEHLVDKTGRQDAVSKMLEKAAISMTNV